MFTALTRLFVFTPVTTLMGNLERLIEGVLARAPARGSTVELEYQDSPEPPAIPNPVSLAIKTAITESGLTQVEVARRLGVKPSLVSRWVHPRYASHTLETLRRLAEVLGLELRVGFAPGEERRAA